MGNSIEFHWLRPSAAQAYAEWMNCEWREQFNSRSMKRGEQPSSTNTQTLNSLPHLLLADKEWSLNVLGWNGIVWFSFSFLSLGGLWAGGPANAPHKKDKPKEKEMKTMEWKQLVCERRWMKRSERIEKWNLFEWSENKWNGANAAWVEWMKRGWAPAAIERKQTTPIPSPRLGVESQRRMELGLRVALHLFFFGLGWLLLCSGLWAQRAMANQTTQRSKGKLFDLN